ncbi:Glucose dehydrogenase like protein [Argiope bruennichi]|uniref:Glucose dehydrogenase like protein n=1 Tax=Argiope bruennichi TaxID=94029 RepID=A0A8T0EK11_ARGBR|nr:Glucose dehydrogenase like protein [Argiope bruennichi]
MLKILLKVSLCVVLVAIATNSILKRIWISHGIINEPRPKYDIIIVGGGSSGCVLARRLWEKSNMSILVIESGTTAPWISLVPLLAPALQGYTADWAYKTATQTHTHLGTNDRQSSWPRGKVLGGSSVLNYLLHMWGAKSDFDNLWNDSGETGWDFESVRHYFKKSESFQRVSGASKTGMRGDFGPMPVKEFNASSSPLASAFLEGLSSLGIKIGDLNGEIENGAMPSQSNIWNGWRVSVVDAYLDSILDNANIHLLTSTQAIQIIMENNRATGVLAVNLYSGTTYHIEAKYEVILSAGVVETPHLLMLSGIGPKEQLERFGIPVVADIPGVGQNLRDHLNVPLYFHLDAPVSTTTAKVRTPSEIWKYGTKGKGYLANSGIEVVVRLPVPGDNSSHSKMYFMLFNLGSVNGDLFSSIANFKNDTFQETFPGSTNDSKEGFIILASCTQPLSKGEVLLASANPMKAPIIDPNYLSREEDVKCLIKALKTAARLGSTKPMRKLGARLHLPGYGHCSNYSQSLENDKFLECWLRTSAITAYHPVGTCAMGPDDDPMAVLDLKLK